MPTPCTHKCCCRTGSRGGTAGVTCLFPTALATWRAPRQSQDWTQGWLTPNSCPPLCTNLPPSEEGPEPVEGPRAVSGPAQATPPLRYGSCGPLPRGPYRGRTRSAAISHRVGLSMPASCGRPPSPSPQCSCSLPEPSRPFLSCSAHSLPSYPCTHSSLVIHVEVLALAHVAFSSYSISLRTEGSQV